MLRCRICGNEGVRPLENADSISYWEANIARDNGYNVFRCNCGFSWMELSPGEEYFDEVIEGVPVKTLNDFRHLLGMGSVTEAVLEDVLLRIHDWGTFPMNSLNDEYIVKNIKYLKEHARNS